MSDKPINNQNLIATRYGFISYSELVEKLDRLEKLEAENARLREALEDIVDSGNESYMYNKAKKALERSEG